MTQTENFGTLTNGQIITIGSTVDGLTYRAFVLTLGTTQLLGMFFNVAPNSGTFTISSSVGSGSNNASSYDTSTCIFEGIVSSTPFSSISLISSTQTTAT